MTLSILSCLLASTSVHHLFTKHEKHLCTENERQVQFKDEGLCYDLLSLFKKERAWARVGRTCFRCGKEKWSHVY
jgi:hypothetical protein